MEGKSGQDKPKVQEDNATEMDAILEERKKLIEKAEDRGVKKSKLKISSVSEEVKKPEITVKSGLNKLRISSSSELSAPSDLRATNKRTSEKQSDKQVFDRQSIRESLLKIQERKKDKFEEKDIVEDNTAKRLGSIGVKNSGEKKNEFVLPEETIKPLDTTKEELSYTKDISISILQWAGIAISLTWVAFCFFHSVRSGGFIGLTPSEFGLVVSGILVPVALFWMIFSHFMRGAEVQQYAENLRREMQIGEVSSDAQTLMVREDVELLCRQAAALTTSTQAVIQALSKARQGLRAEIRDFVGVSQKTEFHIDRLSGTLNNRTARLLELTDEIETRTSNLDDKTQIGAAAWEELTELVLSRADEMETAMSRGAQKLLGAADVMKEKTRGIETHFEDSFDSLNRSVDFVAEQLQALGTQFDGHTKELSDTAENVSVEVQNLSEMIESQISTLEDVTGRTFKAMESSGQTIQDQRDALENSADEVSKQLDQISSIIKVSVDGIYDAADHVVNKTEAIEDRIVSQSENITVSLENINEVSRNLCTEVDRVDGLSRTLTERLSEGVSNSVERSQDIMEVVEEAALLIAKSTNEARDKSEELMESATQQISKLNSVGETNVEQVKLILTMLEKSRKQIDGASRYADKQIDRLAGVVDMQSEKLNQSGVVMKERTRLVEQALRDALGDIEKVMSDVDTKHHKVEDSLRQRIADLKEASQTASSATQKIRDALQVQENDISAITDRSREISKIMEGVATFSRAVNEEVSKSKNYLGNAVQESLEGMDKVSKSIDKHSKMLSAISKASVEDLTKLEGQVVVRCNKLANSTHEAVTQLTLLDESIENNTVSLERNARNSVDSVKEIKDVLEGIEEITETNLVSLGQAGVMFDRRLEDLRVGADKAATVLTNSSDILDDRVQNMERTSRIASETMKDISDIQNSMEDRFSSISKSIEDSLTQIHDMGEVLTGTTQILDGTADRVLKRFDEVGGKVLKQTDTLNESAEKSAQLAEFLVSRVREDTEKILKATNESLTSMRQASDEFMSYTDSICEKIDYTQDDTRSYSKELREQAEAIEDVSLQTVKSISEAVLTLKDCLEDVTDSSEQVFSHLGSSNDALNEETEKLLQAAADALKATSDTTQTIGENSSSLSALMDEMKRKENTLSQEVSNSTAKFAIEELHSISVDLTRKSEGKIPEKAWKRFQKGDVSIFTRRLARGESGIPVKSLQDKFLTDPEYRGYVQRYIRQFETIYEDSIQDDHGNFVGSTIVSSEIGKLYHILCDVSGQKPIDMDDFDRDVA
jgi:methyl-accepting chemotaxis protein